MFKFSGIVLACAALLGGVNNVALAHGEKKHSSAPVVKEQTDWGIAGDAFNVARTIDVSMGDDMRFKPAVIEALRLVTKIEGEAYEDFVRRDDFKEAVGEIKQDMKDGFNKIDNTLGLIFKKLEKKEDKE